MISLRMLSVLAVPLVVLVAVASGQTGSPSRPDPQEGPSAKEEILEEVDEALVVLDEAGVPPTREDLASFLAVAESSSPPVSSRGPWRHWQGSLRVRVGYFQEAGWDRYGRVSLSSRWLGIRARYRKHATGWEEAAATADLKAGPLELRWGALGLGQGYGLLIGAPGRGATLGADGRFAPRRNRLVRWLGSVDSRVLTGLGARLDLGSWIFRFLTGNSGAKTLGPGRTSCLQVNGRGEGWQVAAAALADRWVRGGSLAGKWSGGPINCSFETMMRRPAPTVPLVGAAVVQMRWDLAPGAGLEAMWGLSDLPWSPSLASRPAVLPGWDGRGFALRGFVSLGPVSYLRGLIHRGSKLDRTGERTRQDKVLVDLQGGRTLQPGWELAVRFRRTDRRWWGWRERYPWQPPQPQGEESHTIISAQVTAEGPGLRGRLLARTYGKASATGNGRRSLVTLSVTHQAGPGWKVKGTWVTAWGDPVDLVSAVSPLTGLVLPRHWGHWRSEMVLGFEWASGPARLQAGWSGRRPELELGTRLVHTLWAEAALRW